MLYLGQRNNKIIGIQTDAIIEDEFDIVKANKKLQDMTLTQAVYWFKLYCPNAYKNGYREIHLDNIKSAVKHTAN